MDDGNSAGSSAKKLREGPFHAYSKSSYCIFETFIDIPFLKFVWISIL